MRALERGLANGPRTRLQRRRLAGLKPKRAGSAFLDESPFYEFRATGRVAPGVGLIGRAKSHVGHAERRRLRSVNRAPQQRCPRAREHRPGTARQRGSRRGTTTRAGPDDPDSSDPPGELVPQAWGAIAGRTR